MRENDWGVHLVLIDRGRDVELLGDLRGCPLAERGGVVRALGNGPIVHLLEEVDCLQDRLTGELRLVADGPAATERASPLLELEPKGNRLGEQMRQPQAELVGPLSELDGKCEPIVDGGW